MPTQVQMTLEQLALYQALMSIDGDGAGATRELFARLLRSRLVTEVDGRLALTPGGVQLCRSLQHRLAAEREVALGGVA